jgi:hypothetical protein
VRKGRIGNNKRAHGKLPGSVPVRSSANLTSTQY